MRNAFTADGRAAEIGTYAFGFSWGSWAALLLATILFCVGMRGEAVRASWASREGEAPAAEGRST